jgi:uncharacterized protein YjbI with pentapeptide repeats
VFGRLLRVTGAVLVIAAALVVPVLTMSAPASADAVVDGCTIVSNPTPSNFTNCPGADLAGVDLAGINLSFANFSGASFAGCSQGSGSFLGIPIVTVSCFGADLSGAQLVDANLSGSSFASSLLVPEPPFPPAAGLGAADLSDANLSGANLSGAGLETCLFFSFCAGASLNGANVTGTLFMPPNQTVQVTSTTGAVVTYPATGANCSPPSGSTFPVGTTTVSCSVSDFQGGVATGTFTVTVDLPTTTSIKSSTNPSVHGQPVTYAASVSPAPPGGTVAFTDDGSPIAGCSAVPLSGAGANCSDIPDTTGAHNVVATYSGSGGFLGSASPSVTQVVTKTPCTTLAGCNLSGLNLGNAGMAGADLQAANLNGTNLTDANLSGANLSGANLNDANVTGGNLSGASVTVDTNFNRATWRHTTCPDGTSSDNDGGTCLGHL